MIRINQTTSPDAFGMQQYRKKPVVINAVRIMEPFEVETLEGLMQGDAGDWLLQGIKGEFYPCRNDIFELTYEKVSNG